MSYLTVDARPNQQLVMLVNDTDWTILCSITTDNRGTATTFVSPDIIYTDFLEVLSFLQAQNITKSIVLNNQVALTVLPLVAQAYTNQAVPAGMHFTLKASVNGYNGNANVNSFNASDAALKNVSLSSLAAANSLTLTITTS
jgi:hypothetical protein